MFKNVIPPKKYDTKLNSARYQQSYITIIREERVLNVHHGPQDLHTHILVICVLATPTRLQAP